MSAAPEAPWRAGLRAARANLLPGLVVQGAMVATVLAYFLVPSARPVFDRLALWKAGGGYLFSALAAVLAGAFVPEVLRILVFQSGRASRRNLGNFFFAAAFWGWSGMQVDFFYRLQTFWFGENDGVATVVKKVLVDQLVYCPLVAAPLTVILYAWRAERFRRGALPGYFTARFYRRSILPALVANWGLWLPIVAALYSLPGLLQIPLFSLALTLWVLLFTWMSEQETGPPGPQA